MVFLDTALAIALFVGGLFFTIWWWSVTILPLVHGFPRSLYWAMRGWVKWRMVLLYVLGPLFWTIVVVGVYLTSLLFLPNVFRSNAWIDGQILGLVVSFWKTTFSRSGRKDLSLSFYYSIRPHLTPSGAFHMGITNEPDKWELAPAEYNLGVKYDKGLGVLQDHAEAASWYREAAEKGDNQAQFNLGTMYFQGQGVPQDFGEAAKWFLTAAEQGDAKAQHNIGAMYFNGTGVPKDCVLAHMWVSLAAQQGHGEAKKELQHISSQMTQQEIVQAEKLAGEWMPKK